MPRLVNPYVTLRAFEQRDASLIASVADDALIPLISTVPTSGSPGDVDAYLQRQHERLTTGQGYSFAVTDSATDQTVGQIGLWTTRLEPVALRPATGSHLSSGDAATSALRCRR